MRLEVDGVLKSWAVPKGPSTDPLDRDERWLLIRQRDEDADARRNPVSSQPESVLSGRTNEEVAAEDPPR